MGVFDFLTISGGGVVVVFNLLTLASGGGWVDRNWQILDDVIN